jgi:hypothetical protein
VPTGVASEAVLVSRVLHRCRAERERDPGPNEATGAADATHLIPLEPTAEDVASMHEWAGDAGGAQVGMGDDASSESHAGGGDDVDDGGEDEGFGGSAAGAYTRSHQSST